MFYVHIQLGLISKGRSFVVFYDPQGMIQLSILLNHPSMRLLCVYEAVGCMKCLTAISLFMHGECSKHS